MNIAWNIAWNIASREDRCKRGPSLPARGRWRRILVCLIGALASGTAAWALVGPSRIAPELEPYVVTVLNRSAGSAGFCTASVIARSIVLTAAHCVSTPGDSRIFFRDGKGAPVLIEVASIAVNPGYRPDAIRRRLVSIDLALVRLAEPLPAAFTPIELAQSSAVEIGQKFLIAGFGVADENEGKTGGILRSGVLAASGPKSQILLWVTDPSGRGLGGCTGDSGAPILAFDRPVVVAVAIWAKGQNGRQCGALTQAVLVAPQRHWIDAIQTAWGAN